MKREELKMKKDCYRVVNQKTCGQQNFSLFPFHFSFVSGDPVSVEEVSVVGDITVGGNGAVSVGNVISATTDTGLFVGGLAGFVRGTGAGAELHNLNYSRGIITVNLNSGGAWIGGAIGSIRENGTVTNCFSMQSQFDINKYGSGGIFFVGSFAGLLYRGRVENCYTEGPVTVIAGSDADGDILAGGFAGRIEVNTSYCYAKGDVTVENYDGHTLVGGFTGFMSAAVTLANSYASGNVTATNRGTGTTENYSAVGGSTPAIAAGGLVGYSNNANFVIQNCYALGNVFANKPEGDGGIFAGGLIGVTLGRTENSFATGSVIAHRASSNNDVTTGGTGLPSVQRAIYAGGLIGRKTNNTNTRNNAALGASVTATGPGVLNVGRVFGAREDGGTISNRAFDGMRLFTSTTYGGTPTGGIVTENTITYITEKETVTILVDHDNDPDTLDIKIEYERDIVVEDKVPTPNYGASQSHGANATDSEFRRRDFWQNAAPTSGDPLPNHGLGFSAAVWDFSQVANWGYPFLRGVGGVGLLGGQ